jgi:hypothetical protein
MNEEKNCETLDKEKYFQSLSEDEQIKYVSSWGEYIIYIKNPSEKVQLYAVKYGMARIEFIQNPTEKVQIEYIKSFYYNEYFYDDYDYVINNYITSTKAKELYNKLKTVSRIIK